MNEPCPLVVKYSESALMFIEYVSIASSIII